MTKNGIRGYVVLLLMLAVFIVASFAPPFQRNSVFWIAFVFGLIAIAGQVYVFRISFIKGEDAKSRFYGFPIARLGAIYLIVQFIVSILEMCFAAYIPFWVVLILNMILFVAAAIGCIAADVMRDEIERQDTVIKSDVSEMRALQSKANAIAGMCGDASVKTNLQKLADDLRYSDPVSSEHTKDIEKELTETVNQLQHAITEGDMKKADTLCEKAQGLLIERNRLCKLGK